MPQAVQAAAPSPSVQGLVLGHPAAVAVDLQVAGLQKGFDGHTHILENISFQVLRRQSVVLGLVGAGGIGIELKAAMDMFRYGQAATTILMIYALVIVVEQISATVRRRVI